MFEQKELPYHYFNCRLYEQDRANKLKYLTNRDKARIHMWSALDLSKA
jgi:hypothetical protein